MNPLDLIALTPFPRGCEPEAFETLIGNATSALGMSYWQYHRAFEANHYHRCARIAFQNGGSDA